MGNRDNILSLEVIGHHEVITGNWGVPYELSRRDIVINIVFFVKSKFRLHGMRIKWSNLIINLECLELKRP